MAKWGEGDARWKVEDLGTAGRNVNSWHWEEKNALPWSKEKLTELLGGVFLVDQDGVHVRLEDGVELSGDAVVNQRKGKLIPAYELELKVKWVGTDNEGKELAKGDVKLPYISEENHDEDPEVVVTVASGGDAGEKIRGMIVKHGRPIVHKAIASFVKELHAGGPVKRVDGNGASYDLEDRCNGDSIKSSQTSSPKDSTEGSINRAGDADLPGKEKQVKGTNSITLTETFFCSPKDLYECFTNAAKIRAYTGSPAVVELKEGGELSMFGGSVEGVYRELEEPSRLIMDWRFSSWPEGCLSKVSLEFTENDKGSTVLKLRQTEIPYQDKYGNHDVIGMTQAGWKQQVLMRIRQVFGFGA